jgi:hypothetical protein
MVNSWSLLYDTMYGPEDEKNYLDWKKLYSGTHEDYELTADGFVWPKSNDNQSTNEMSDYLNAFNYPDTLNINSPMQSSTGFNFNTPTETNKNGFWKYEEDKTLKEVEQYLSSTYHSHYTSQDSKTQTLDLIESIGDAEAFTRSNAIKYLSRFGKKNGKSKQDILKAIHYCILLYHFAGLHKNTVSDFHY